MPESKVTYCRTNRISSHHLFHKTTLTDFLPSQDIHPSQRKQEVTNPPCFRPVPFLAQWPCLVSPKNRGSEKKKKKKIPTPSSPSPSSGFGAQLSSYLLVFLFFFPVRNFSHVLGYGETREDGDISPQIIGRESGVCGSGDCTSFTDLSCPSGTTVPFLAGAHESAISKKTMRTRPCF